MFETIFSRPCTIAIHQAAPLYEERCRYLLRHAQSGATADTLRAIAHDQLSLINHLNLQANQRISVRQIEDAGSDWLNGFVQRFGHEPSLKRRKRFIHCARNWLRFIGWLSESRLSRHRYEAEVSMFNTFAQQQCGLSDAYVNSICNVAGRFFEWLEQHGLSLDEVRLSDIDEALVSDRIFGQCSRNTTKTQINCLGRFLRYAEQQRWCVAGLADGIKPPRMFPNETIPKGLGRDEVLKLLATTESDHAIDKRDRAILMVLSTYGLRSSEVCGLTLDDLSWTDELLTVRRCKSGQIHIYPLSQAVGEAIVRYLREVRPLVRQRTLFLTMNARRGPITRQGVYMMVVGRLKKIGIAGKGKGPHALRHAAAQHLLEHNQSMKVIADYLGHRNVDSASVYAKINLNQLREVGDVSLEGLI